MPTPVRMHAANLFSDMVGDVRARPGQLANAMKLIGDIGHGVVVILSNMQSDILSRVVLAHDSAVDKGPSELRDYGIGAQILTDIGVRDMILISNTEHKIYGLDGYDLHVVEQRPIPLDVIDV